MPSAASRIELSGPAGLGLIGGDPGLQRAEAGERAKRQWPRVRGQKGAAMGGSRPGWPAIHQARIAVGERKCRKLPWQPKGRTAG